MSNSLNNSLNSSSKPSYKDMRPVHTIILFENSSSSLISELNKELYFHVGNTKFNTGIEIDLLQDYVLISLDTFRKYRYADVKKGRTEIRECDYDSTQYKDKDVTEKMKLDRMKDEMDKLRVLSEEKDAEIKERDNKIEEKNAEIARLKRQLEEQNK